ncbi:MAG: endonuclease/exonuclease/phosphatase family protein [Planctomycetota bacterium]
MLFRILCIWLMFTGMVVSDQKPISIDGSFDDWEGVTPHYVDAFGDADNSGFDFGRLWLADDDDFLFIRIETATEDNWNNNTNVRLYIDTDLDGTTGMPIGGIGAELEWRFGEGMGFLHAGEPTEILGSAIRLRGGPTITPKQIELAIGRESKLAQDLLFASNGIRILVHDTASGDQIPESGELLDYQFDEGELPPETIIPISRDEESDLRMMTHNVLFDRPWNSTFEPSFGRQWQAVNPDILNFQEIYDNTAEETIELVSRWVPLAKGETWYAAQRSDCVTVSRYPILNSWALNGNLAVLIDASEKVGTEILVVNAHLPCCGNDGSRQAEIDRIMSFIRDAKSSLNGVSLAPGTPIFITGDLNLVRLSQQLTSLIDGDIVNQEFGAGFDPDWDGTSLRNIISRQTEKRMGYTWRFDGGLFWPGQLDYTIFSDSVMELGNHFILFTPEIENPGELGLQLNDSLVSDHFVLCTDFRPQSNFILGDLNNDQMTDLLDVGPFVEVLAEGGFLIQADVNEDGTFDLLDVMPFIDILNDAG